MSLARESSTTLVQTIISQVQQELQEKGPTPIFQLSNLEVLLPNGHTTTLLNYSLNLLNGRNKLLKFLQTIPGVRIDGSQQSKGSPLYYIASFHAQDLLSTKANSSFSDLSSSTSCLSKTDSSKSPRSSPKPSSKVMLRNDARISNNSSDLSRALAC